MRAAANGCNDSALAEGVFVAWEEVACLLCGSDALTPLLEASDPLRRQHGLRFLIVRCRICGLCFTNPRPSFRGMRQFYPLEYACHHAKQSPAKSRFRKADPMSKLLSMQAKARLLDFGCGAGDFLRRMRNLGWNVTGLELAEEAVRRVPRESGLQIHAGTLPQPLWADASFEAITMRQSLEHVHDPLTVLREAFRLLTPGGRLLVTVPNLDSLSSRWFGANWHGLDVPRHLTHFTPDTLRGMLQRAGFARITLRQERRSSWMRHSARLAQQRQQCGFLARCLHTRFASGLAGWWGAWSGRGESLLATAEAN